MKLSTIASRICWGWKNKRGQRKMLQHMDTSGTRAQWQDTGPWKCLRTLGLGCITTTNNLATFLSPASEGWENVIFSVCSHLLGGGGDPVPGLDRRGGGLDRWSYLISGLDRGQWDPIPGPDGGTPSQVQTGVVPHPRSGWGGTPSQVQTGGTPSCWLGGGVTPSNIRTGVPPIKTG